jgi:hypothetical protein
MSSATCLPRPCLYVGTKASASRLSARREQALRNMVWEDVRRQLEDDPARQRLLIETFINQKGK